MSGMQRGSNAPASFVKPINTAQRQPLKHSTQQVSAQHTGGSALQAKANQQGQLYDKVDSQLPCATPTHKVATHKHQQQQLATSAQHGSLHMQNAAEQLGSKVRQQVKRGAEKLVQPQPKQKPIPSQTGVQRKCNRIMGAPCACCGCTGESLLRSQEHTQPNLQLPWIVVAILLAVYVLF